MKGHIYILVFKSYTAVAIKYNRQVVTLSTMLEILCHFQEK